MIALRSVLRQRTSNHADASSCGDDSPRAGDRQTDSRSSRLVGLAILTLIGIWLLGGIAARSLPGQAFAISPSFAGSHPSEGMQAGGVETPNQQTTAQAKALPAFCFPTDITCLLSAAMQWATQQLLGSLQPLIDAIDHDPLNVISQTPLCVSACPTQNSPYQQNATIGTFVTWSIGVVDAAVAVFIVLAGYNIMIARQIGASYADIATFIPRIALSVLAANVCLFFLQFFIDLENALCLEVVHFFDLNVLTTTMVGIFDGRAIASKWGW